MTRLLAAGLAAALAASLLACGPPDHVPAGKEGDCARCHLPSFDGARAHRGKKPTTCAVCHTQKGWHPITLDHPWELDGAHKKTPCFRCHTGTAPKYHGLPGECVDCHRDEYKKAKRHENKPKTCEDCHSTTTWKKKRRKDGEP